MPTIKRRVEMNLPQFIAWAVDNHITGSFYANNRVNAKRIRFEFGGIVSSHGELRSYDTFTVEVEEEITEDTVIPKLLTTFKKIYLKDDFGYQRVRIDEDFKIQLMLNKAEAHREKIETLHMVNDDGTHTLLWRDGRLVN